MNKISTDERKRVVACLVEGIFPESGKVRVLRFWYTARNPDRLRLGR